MTKKIIGYTHLQWTCPACRQKNRGASKKCTSCQAPQPEDVVFEQPSQEQLLTDEQAIAQAQKGPDIHCAYCGTRNSADLTHCLQCGGDLTEGTIRETGGTLGTHRPQAVPDVDCDYCGTMNPADALSCSNCGASMAKAEPKRPSAPTSTRPRPHQKISPVLIGILVFGCIGAAVLMFLFNRTDDVIGRVATVEWERSIIIEQLGPVNYEDWLNEVPSDANVGVCTERIHHSQSNPAPGATEICGTPYTLDTGTGFGEVVQNCQYQVYDDWCEYTVMEWQTIDSISVQGNDYNPSWPQYTLSTNQQYGEQEERYRVFFDTDGGSYSYGTSNLERFNQFQIGTNWVLEVNSFNMVVGVEPAQ